MIPQSYPLQVQFEPRDAESVLRPGWYDVIGWDEETLSPFVVAQHRGLPMLIDWQYEVRHWARPTEVTETVTPPEPTLFGWVLDQVLAWRARRKFGS